MYKPTTVDSVCEALAKLGVRERKELKEVETIFGFRATSWPLKGVNGDGQYVIMKGLISGIYSVPVKGKVLCFSQVRKLA